MINPESGPMPSHRTILVVEDEVLIRLVICDLLRDLGQIVVEAASADQALTYLKSDPSVQLVFSDVRMPGSLDGLGLAQILRSQYPHIVVLLTSGHLLPKDVDAETILFPKPYPLEETANRIIAILEQKGAVE